MIDLAQLAGLDYVFYHLHIRVVARLEADGDYLAVSLLGLSYLNGLVEGDAHGLFEQDIDPVVERVYGALRVGHIVGADADRVKLLVVYELLMRAVDSDSLGGVPFLEEGLGLAVNKIRHADKLNVGHLEIFADVALRYPACADYTDLELLARVDAVIVLILFEEVQVVCSFVRHFFTSLFYIFTGCALFCLYDLGLREYHFALVVSQQASFTLLERIVKLQRAYRRSAKRRNAVPNRREHPLDLMVLALAYLNAHRGGVIAQLFELRGQTFRAVAEHRALPQNIELLLAYAALERRLIGLVDMVGRRDESMGKVAVVGDYQKPGSILVESACGEEPAPAELGRQEIDDRRAVGILCGAEHAGGLVEHYIEISAHGDCFSVYLQLVGIYVNLLVGRKYFFAVHLDRAASYELPCAAAGNIHLLCNCFIEPVQCGAPFG